MARIRITKEFSFEASHFLPGYDGLCANMHGHSYRLFVTLIGSPLQQVGAPKDGMVLDFGLLKSIVQNQLVGILDHSLIVRRGSWRESQNVKEDMRVVEVDFQPTCENLLPWMAEKIISALPPNVSLHALKIHETATSYAEWYAQDNV